MEERKRGKKGAGKSLGSVVAEKTLEESEAGMAETGVEAVGVRPGFPHHNLHGLHEQVEPPQRGRQVQRQGSRGERHREQYRQHHLLLPFLFYIGTEEKVQRRMGI
ncbi:hypothetical protein MLD38_009697 [Melastoma candidum]|uniref:Uncharacterized protein n=1 Tax=Melastoma candidum TaxID=119954 RepID=A0ACB9RXT8_9MYRT|nr:hypothetical protein MLD38_009697 [Melastoma candidum]